MIHHLVVDRERVGGGGVGRALCVDKKTPKLAYSTLHSVMPGRLICVYARRIYSNIDNPLSEGVNPKEEECFR